MKFAITLLMLAGGGGYAASSAYDGVSIGSTAGLLLANARVYLSGSVFGGCFCMVAPPGTDVGNVTPGHSQLAVLSSSHAIYFDPHVRWQYWPGEDRPVDLQPMIELPVVIWRVSQVEQTAPIDAKFAEDRFAAEHTGILIKKTIRDVKQIGSRIKAANCETASTLTSLPDPDVPGQQLFDPKALNVYYVDSCGPTCGGGGMSCPHDRRIAFVYPVGNDPALLHEMGHALLGRVGDTHWNLSLDAENVMLDKAPLRQTLSTGQTIAMSFEETSVLAQLKLQKTPLRCETDCPPIEFDETWSDCKTPPQLPISTTDPLTEWMECFECTDGQLARVTNQLGPPLGSLVSRAEGVLFDQGLANWLPAPVGPYAANTVARRQRRAVLLLRFFALQNNEQAGRARQAIQRATKLDVRQDVREMITAAEAALPLK